MKKLDVFYDKENEVYQVRTKANAVVIEFASKEKENIFLEISKLYDKAEFITCPQMIKALKKHHDHAQVLDVLKELRDVGILNPGNFEDTDNILSDMEQKKPSIYTPMTDFHDTVIGLIGDPSVMNLVKASLKEKGITHFNQVQTPADVDASDIASVIRRSDFIVVDEINYSPVLMERINALALENNKPWLLIEGAIDTVNYSVGPIFYGKETGCYECYQNRLLVNDNNRQYTRAYHGYLSESGKWAQPEQVPLPVAHILASLAAMDVVRFLQGYSVPVLWRNTLVFNSITFSMEKHYFIKAPVCHVCNPEVDYSPSPWLEALAY